MIYLRSAKEVELIRESCKIVVDCLKHVKGLVKPGVSTMELNRVIDQFIREHGAKPAFKGYRGFPASACISVEDAVVHGIPKETQILLEGQIVGIDVGVYKNGYYGDSAITFAVGKISEEKQRLMDVTRSSLYEGIKKALTGNRVHDISAAVQSHVESYGYSVVRELVGHGIGKSLHEDPQVPNFGKAGTGARLKPGMVFCVEPMVNMGSYEVETEKDNWTVVTADGKPSAHFEHTIHITDDGPEILTKNDLF